MPWVLWLSIKAVMGLPWELQVMLSQYADIRKCSMSDRNMISVKKNFFYNFRCNSDVYP